MKGGDKLRGRRRVLALLSGLPLLPAAPGLGNNHLSQTTRRTSGVTPFAPVVPGYVMRFPRDEGSHPEFRIEWWYVTGLLRVAARQPAGFQITFFRARPALKQDNPSAFSPHQIIIAHAALSDPERGRLIHAERAARTAFDLAGAATGRTSVWIDDWALEQQGSTYRARLTAPELQFDFRFSATQPPLLQGENGLSRKGPAAESASYYYSLPQLELHGTIVSSGHRRSVSGRAWLDHEWTSRYMDAAASGWDWVCANFADGSALMAFRMRDAQGRSYWAGGTLRGTDGTRQVFGPAEIVFKPGRTWRSARTGTTYPVAWTVQAGDLSLSIEPLMDDQELDARRTTGTIYWEGAVRVLSGAVTVGHGYLELTGYWRPFRF